MSKAFDSSEPVAKRLADGVAKIALALRSRAWRGATWEKLTPTQGQILGLLNDSHEPLRLTDIADALGVTPASASQAVGSLIGKGLMHRQEAEANRRALALTLTPEGALVAQRVAEWPHFLADAFETLSAAEQRMVLLAILKVLRTLEVKGEIASARICLTCESFRAMAKTEGAEPHQCTSIGAYLSDAQLRIGCPFFNRASPDLHEANWHALLARDEAAA